MGFGKFGADGIIKNIEKSSGSLDQKKVTLLGTLIQGDGKTLLELTKKENSLVALFDENKFDSINESFRTAFEYSGEILDPKCYFGVMKPAEGKIHKSCAIRCISGGIPPVFRAIIENGQYEYYILLGSEGQKINQEILTHIGERVVIKGTSNYRNGWSILYADPMDIVQIEN